MAGLIAAGLVLGLAACSEEISTATPTSGAAEPSYVPGADAPDLCSTLADSTHLAALPDALGVLAAAPDDPDATATITGANADLTSARADAATAGITAELPSLDVLIANLTAATEQSVTDDLLVKVAADLTALGEQTQAVCGFPA